MPKACEIKILNVFVLKHAIVEHQDSCKLSVDFLAADGRARATKFTIEVYLECGQPIVKKVDVVKSQRWFLASNGKA